MSLVMVDYLPAFGRAKRLSAFNIAPILIPYPLLRFHRMSSHAPSFQLMAEMMVTCREHFRCNDCAIVVRPSSNDRIQFLNENLLRESSQLPYPFFRSQ